MGISTSNVPMLAEIVHVFIASNLYYNNFLLNILTLLAKKDFNLTVATFKVIYALSPFSLLFHINFYL